MNSFKCKTEIARRDSALAWWHQGAHIGVEPSKTQELIGELSSIIRRHGESPEMILALGFLLGDILVGAKEYINNGDDGERYLHSILFAPKLADPLALPERVLLDDIVIELAGGTHED